MPSKFNPSDFQDYALRLSSILSAQNWDAVSTLANDLADAWQRNAQVLICGNGGSAANAIHWANDLFYVIAKSGGKGIRVLALPANQAVVTCLANDVDYDAIFSTQVATFGQEGDLLIVLSGSGNSPNVTRAIRQAKSQGIKTYAITGFSGGECKQIADVPIHFAVDDMQIAEDLQLVVCHMLAQGLAKGGKP